jgi:hypothetical protein
MSQNRVEENKPQKIAAEEITQEMKDDLLEFIDLCEQIKASKDGIKVFVERKAELERQIADFMIHNDIPGFVFPNGRISKFDKKITKPLNKDSLHETIVEQFADEKAASEVTEKVFSKRPSTTVQKIRVTSKRAPKRRGTSPP